MQLGGNIGSGMAVREEIEHNLRRVHDKSECLLAHLLLFLLVSPKII